MLNKAILLASATRTRPRTSKVKPAEQPKAEVLQLGAPRITLLPVWRVDVTIEKEAA